MSGRTLEDVLRKHGGFDYAAWRAYVCVCGVELPLDGSRVTHSDHVAAEVRAWLAEELAGEGLREAAATKHLGGLWARQGKAAASQHVYKCRCGAWHVGGRRKKFGRRRVQR